MSLFRSNSRLRLLRSLMASLLPPLLASALLTLVAYTQNVDFMPVRALWLPLGVAASVAFATWLLLLVLLRAPAVASVSAVVFVFFNAAGAPLLRRMPDLGLWSAADGRLSPAFVLITLIGLSLLVVTGLVGRRRPVHCAQVARLLTLFLIANLLFASARIVWLDSKRPRSVTLFQPPTATRSSALQLQECPTVVHLVLDGFARADILASRYDYDNGAFIRRLEAHGFQVFSGARANYIQTALSLSSMLNLDYLAAPTGAMSNRYDRTPLLGAIQSNHVVDTFRRAGYEIVNFPSGYDFTDDIGADWRGAPHFFNELAANQWGRSWFGMLVDGCNYETLQHVKRVEAVFHQLPGILARSKRPQYVFAHVVCPHPPFVFDETGPRDESIPYDLQDGSDRVHSGFSQQDYRREYLAQVRYIAGQVEGLIKQVLAEPPRPLVILMHGDHGPGSGLRWESREESDVAERSAIFCALYFPGKLHAALPADLTLVNIFRVIFNRYLQTDYPLLPNHTFFTRWSLPYQPEQID